jgi:chromosome segregation ATPase
MSEILKHFQTLEVKLEHLIKKVTDLQEENTDLQTRIAAVQDKDQQLTKSQKKVSTIEKKQFEIDANLKKLSEEREVIRSKIEKMLDEIAVLNI